MDWISVSQISTFSAKLVLPSVRVGSTPVSCVQILFDARSNKLEVLDAHSVVLDAHSMVFDAHSLVQI